FAVLGVPVHVSGNEQIQFAVIVVVEKSGGDGPAATSHSCLRRHVGEGSVAVVVIQNISSVTGHVQIGVAVVIIIAHGHSHAVIPISSIRQPGLLGHIGEAAILVLTEEPIPVAGVMTVEIIRCGQGGGQASPVHEKDVQQAIVVVVEQSYSSRHGFDQV